MRAEKQKNSDFEQLERQLNRFADLFEEKGYYIERNLLNLPKRYSDTVISYMNESVGWIDLKNNIEELEKDFEQLKGNLFDVMHQLDEIESRLSKGEWSK